jgi:glycosyltransferase involved in cell wall biosynthesis
VIPTRGRPGYLDVTLASVAPQAQVAGAEVLVVNDGGSADAAAVAARHGAVVIELPPPGGANAARNAGIDAAHSDLIVLLDDDVRAPPGWLAAMLEGVRQAPDHDVFGGPISARLEGGGPRSCGRESPPITTLDRGAVDRDVELVWSANMAIRRQAVQAVGRFDESIRVRGDEEDWERRYIAQGGRVRYVAAAGLEHRRTARDARVDRLARAAYVQGRASRRYDVHKQSQPTVAAELRVLFGCLWHTFRRGCVNGVVLAAHAAGRLREAAAGSR